MKKFKGYNIVDKYPEDGWLKGYFYAKDDDIDRFQEKTTTAYRDLGYIKHKDYTLNLLRIREGEKILDVGCGDGAMMVYCGLWGAEIYGLDISKENIEKTNEYLARFGIKGQAILCDAKKINFPDNYFDKVVSSDFFEHLSFDDNVTVLKEIKRVLKPGRVLVIKTPNLTYLRFSKFFKQIKSIIRLENPFRIIIPHTTGKQPEHIGLVTRGTMVEIIKSAGFLNFRFYYGINSKVERLNYFIGEFFAETPFLRDIFTEELVVMIYKPVITSFFPE